MSPAMVDFESSLQNPNPNPRKGQVSSPSVFGLTRSFNLPRQTLHSAMNSSDPSSGNVDRNADIPNLGNAFASPSPVGAAASSAPGLSRPRLVKVRRHFGSHRGKGTQTPMASSRESRLDSGFNPFRTSAPVSGAKMQMPESRVDSGFDHFQSGVPVSSGSDRGSDSNKMPTGENRVDSNFNTFCVGQSSFDKISVKESEFKSGFNPFRPSANRTTVNGGMGVLRDQLHSWNPFSAQENTGSDGSSGSNMEKFEFGKLGDSGFVFGGAQKSGDSGSVFEGNRMTTGIQSGSSLNSDSKNSLPDDMRKLKIGTVTEPQNINDAGSSFTAEGKDGSNLKSAEASEKGAFVFGSSVKKSSISATNLTDASLAAELPNEMGKLKIGSGMTSRDDNNASFTFTAGRSATTNLSSSSGDVPDAGVFVFRSNGNTNSDSAPDLAKEISSSNLPDEMRKLKIKESRKEKASEKVEDTDFKSKHDVNFSFVFGTGSKNVTGSLDETAENSLRGEIEKLNIKSQTGDNGGTGTSPSSSTTSAKDAHFQKPANRTSPEATFATSIPLPFTFHAGSQGNSSGVHPFCPTQLNNDSRTSGVAGPSSSSSATCPGSQFGSNSFVQPSAGPTENKPMFGFTSNHEEFGMPCMDFRTPKQDASAWSYRDNLFGRQDVEFSARQAASKEMKSKKKRGKVGRKNLMSADKSSQGNPEMGSPRSYSPMDFSPYQETLTADQCLRETSVASGESIPLESTNTNEAVPMDVRDDVIAATQRLNINDFNSKHGEYNEEVSKHHGEGNLSSEGLASENEKPDHKNNGDSAAMGTEAGPSSSSVERQASDGGMTFHFASSSEVVGETNFTFAATPSSQRHPSAGKRHHRRKNLMKVTQDSYASTPNVKVQSVSPSVQFMPLATSSLQQGVCQGQLFSSSSMQLEPGQGLKGDLFASQNEANKESVVQNPMSTAAAQEACEKWRQRGNQAYANGNLSTAEDHYTRGVNCVSPKETSRSCVRALMLCYSNRAATRMSLGRMREALGDCMMAAAIEPTFLRAQVRAANCCLALGEIEDALKHFKNCLQTGYVVSSDQKMRTEATDGLQKAQHVAEYMDRSAELLQRTTYHDAANALEIISEALLMSPYSEKLIEMKAEALLMLRKYEEVVQLCEQTLESAEKNSFSNGTDGKLKDIDASESMKSSPVNLWRWGMVSKSYFYLGRIEEALELLQKLEQLGPVKEKYGSKVLESSTGFATTVRDLLRHKAAGNEAFQAGRHAEAVEHYTAALQCSVESRPFAAICFANRAAAYQALGQITDAIADCSLAIALDSNYPKAISRRATLHEMIRDFGQTINDLQRLISLLEKQTDDDPGQPGTSGRSNCSVNDIRQARLRLATMEEESRKGIPLDMYLILGIESSCTAADVKKAYRKAALRHHPDKAGQFLPRSENGDDGLWKEVAEAVHKDADRLFKMIGEAYTVISDPSKRLRYDAEEELRNAQKKGNVSNTPKAQDVYSYPFERSSSRRHWRDPWKSYGTAQQRWSESSRSNRYS